MKGALEGVKYSGSGIFFAAAALLALLAGGSILAYLRSAAPTGTVLQVAHDLAPGQVIEVGDLQEKVVPVGAVPAGAVRKRAAAVGQRTRYGLVAGDVLREQHLVPAGNSDVAGKLTTMGAEYRAVMLAGDQVPALDHLVPGDHLELTGVLPVQDQRLNSSVAVTLGTGTVLDVRQPNGQMDKGFVLLAMKAGDVSNLALTQRAGLLLVAVEGLMESQPAPPVRMDELTGAAVQASQSTTAKAAH